MSRRTRKILAGIFSTTAQKEKSHTKQSGIEILGQTMDTCKIQGTKCTKLQIYRLTLTPRNKLRRPIADKSAVKL